MVGRSTHYEVLLAQGAEQNLESICDYISEFDRVANANHGLDRLIEVEAGLAQFPERGTCPKELVALGIKDYRQTAFKPYRVIYRVLGGQAVIYLIVDGRRGTCSPCWHVGCWALDPQQLGVSYRSAWLVEHKIMQAMRLRYRISNASW